MVRIVATSMVVVGLAATVFTQPGSDPARNAGISVMRAINTAENAVKQASGNYIELVDLLAHPAMGRVRADIVVDGSVITHQGQQLRLALAADAARYQAMVVPVETCGTAIFSDERGLIYTGKVLDC